MTAKSGFGADLAVMLGGRQLQALRLQRDKCSAGRGFGIWNLSP